MARKSLGQFLKETREAKGMTLREVEAETGISNPHLSQVESGKITQPEMSLLYVLATLYDLGLPLLSVDCRATPEPPGEPTRPPSGRR